ncbi:hypothetical protein [Fodinicola acaciae]|uniref:hypothetical protein n=1 Tax=Fodinicola acaciae TaxID=2681555 RepID=UPI0013D46C54|nr:hypothetical protein [Fodinicola acaciae]
MTGVDVVKVDRGALTAAVVALVAGTRDMTVAGARLVYRLDSTEDDSREAACALFARSMYEVAKALYPETFLTGDGEANTFRDALLHAALHRGNAVSDRCPNCTCPSTAAVAS